MHNPLSDRKEVLLMRDQYGNKEHQVLEVIMRSPGTAPDDIVLECPNLTWNQIFATIDQLSREGMIKLSLKGPGQYVMHICTAPQEVPSSAIV
jgi:hypothetical protein